MNMEIERNTLFVFCFFIIQMSFLGGRILMASSNTCVTHPRRPNHRPRIQHAEKFHPTPASNHSATVVHQPHVPASSRPFTAVNVQRVKTYDFHQVSHSVPVCYEPLEASSPKERSWAWRQARIRLRRCVLGLNSRRVHPAS